MTNLNSPQSEDLPWVRKVQQYIADGQKARALKLLEKVIEYDMPLFAGDLAVLEDRRLAWLYRIALLREWGRTYEALAWACLECELNPGNVAALALKESLKESLTFHGNDPHLGKSAKDVIDGIWKGVGALSRFPLNCRFRFRTGLTAPRDSMSGCPHSTERP